MTEQNNTVSRAWALGWSLVAYLFAGTISTLISVYLPVIVNELKTSPATDQELGSTGGFSKALLLFSITFIIAFIATYRTDRQRVDNIKPSTI